MDICELIEGLNRQREVIAGEMVHQLDFDKLQSDLTEAASALGSLAEKEKLYQRLLEEVKSEIRRMALAVSRAKGDQGTGGLLERLVSSPEIGLDDLLYLREKVKEEFNQCFPVSPQSKTINRTAESRTSISEFKTGRVK
jgi:hypothetical protein